MARAMSAMRDRQAYFGCGGTNSAPVGTNSLVYRTEASSGAVTPPYCLSTRTVDSQSLSDIHPSGLPAVLGVTPVSQDISSSRRAISGETASENFLWVAAARARRLTGN